MNSILPDSGTNQIPIVKEFASKCWRSFLTIFTLLLLGFSAEVSAQATTLAAGDVAIIGMNPDAVDSFAFVLLRDVGSGTTVNVTDNGMNSATAGRTGEGFLTWTAPGARTAGTVITWANGMSLSGTGWSSNNPTNFALNNGGEQLFLFQGNTANWATQSGITLIYGLNFGATIATSAVTASTTFAPSALTAGTTFISFEEILYRNAYFANQATAATNVTVSGTPAQLLALIGDKTKWFGNTSTTVTFPTWNFTVVFGPSISTGGTTSSVNTTYGTASVATSFTTSGTTLGSTAITVTPPAGFEVSKTNGTSGFAATQTLTPTSGTVASTTIWVRLAATTAAGTYSGNVTMTSGTASATKAIPNSTVSKKTITVSNAVGQNKTYDRTNAATITGATPSGLVNNDAITVSGGGTFQNAWVENAKPITANLSLSGAHASSYTLTQPTGLSADITPKDVTLTSVSVANKTYDGTTEATLTATLSGVIAPDEVLFNPLANFASPFVADNISVSSASTIFGADAANYNLVQPTALHANITAKPLTIENAVAQNKVYDGNTNAVITGTLNGVIAPDEVALTLQGSFASAEVGLNIPVTSSSFITGDISNYTLVQPTGLAANISAAALIDQSITFDALANATYGDTDFNLTATASSNLTVSYTSSDENVATVSGNTVTIHNAGTTAITATQSGDLTYDAAGPVVQVLTVLPKELTVSAVSVQNKTYDGNNAATVTGTLQGIVNSDDVVLVGNGTFASANAATGIEVTSTSTLTGSDVANYTLAQPTGLSADITAKTLTVENATANDKPYDTTDFATISGGELMGIIGNDDVSLDGFTGTFASANAGTGISVTAALTLQGSASANYVLEQPTSLSADITPIELTISGIAAENKIYDATTTATISGTPELNGVLNSDEVTVSGTATATFDNENVGIAKPIAISGYTLGGAQAGNYTLAASSGISADITVAALTISNAQAIDKPFDGTTDATITGTLQGVIAGDAVTLVGTGTFAQSAVGMNIAVVSTSTLAGNDASNYEINPQPTGLTANIIAAPTVIANWTYEPLTGSAATPTPNFGTGTSALAGSMTSAGTATGMNTASGCGGQTTGTNAWAISSANPGSSNESSGVRYSTSTVGYQNIKFTWEQRWSNTAANTVRLQYTLNGTTWTNFDMTASNTSFCLGSLNNGRFETNTTGDQFRRISVDLSSIAGANDNANFGVRVVAAYYQNTNQFRQTQTPGSVASAGTWRFDNVKFEGTQVPGPSASVISGNVSICSGENAQLTVAITGGTSPFTVVLSDGTNQITVNNYISGNAIAVNPSATTTYTLVSVTDANAQTGSNNSGAAVINVKQQFAFYVDSDFDGYGAGTATVMVCATDADTPPTGYSLNNSDCNDNASAVHPGATEIPYNGFDDDCDGTIDEGSQLFSQVLPSQCSTTLATISSLIGAVNYAAPVDGYRFKVVNLSTNAEQVIDRNVPHFQLTLLANYDYATTYSISVQLRRNGQWLNYYGPACQISTPAILDQGGAAAITPSQCGVVLPSISTLIATTNLPGVTGYRFRITDMQTNQQQTIDRNYHWFSLTMLNSFLYGRTYAVEVAVKTNGDYSGFGQPCQVTSPAIPQLAQCGATIATTGTLVATTSLNRVTSYRFQLTNLNTMTTTLVDRTLNYFSFNNIPGFVPGAQYAVSVALMTAGSWSDFGEACIIMAPGVSRTIVKGELESMPQTTYGAVAYPSPFTESFALDMDTDAESNVNVSVYDMVGRLVEQREFAIQTIESQQFGERFPSGVYNVIVSQGANVKTLRVVKR